MDKNSKSNLIILIALVVAIIIDIIDALPLELTGVGIIPETVLVFIEDVFLLFIGEPFFKAMIKSSVDIAPVVDLIPWCTLAVLYIILCKLGFDPFGGFGSPSPVIRK